MKRRGKTFQTNMILGAGAGMLILSLGVSAQADDALHVSASGDVGVGTDTPNGRLHILETAIVNTTLRVQNTNATTSNTEIRLENSSGQWILRNNTAGHFVVNVPGDTGFEFRLDGDGNLTIQGSIITGTTTYPDYVFEPDYRLMPLDTLAAFIQENGHLPSVPSRKEVSEASNVVNLSELQMLLLVKVEELTLYTLHQQELIDELQAHSWSGKPQTEGFSMRRAGGLLNEAEETPVYIEQLNERLGAKELENDQLRDRLARIESLLGLGGLKTN